VVLVEPFYLFRLGINNVKLEAQTGMSIVYGDRPGFSDFYIALGLRLAFGREGI
jgi:hypothetical protein